MHRQWQTKLHLWNNHLQVNSSIEAKVKASASVPTTPQVETKPLTLADINNMTPQEIKAHKSEVEKVLKEAFRK